MKSFIALTLLIASVSAGSAGFVSTYNTALTHGIAPLGYQTHAAVAPLTYAAPAAAVTQFGYQTVTNNVVAAPVAPITYAAPAALAIPSVTKTQYHAQDVLGQASFGYAYPGQAHHTVRDAGGNVRGSYAYINPDGNEIRVNYVADQGGFRAESNALPPAPVHVVPGAVAAAPIAVPVTVGAGVPADTPEVVEARIAHANAHVQARARNLLRKKRGIVAAPIATYATAAIPAATALTYASAIAHPLHAYSATTVHHPTAFSTYSAEHHPFTTYAAVAPSIVAPAAYTQIHNNPGHAVSYRVY